MNTTYEPLKISRGDFNELSAGIQFGYASVGTTVTTVWSGEAHQPGLYIYPPNSGELMYVSSDDANDTDGGSGARTVALTGLDENFDLVNDVVTLNGLTQVASTKLFSRMFFARVVTSGSSVGQTGNIYIAQAGATLGIPDNTIYSVMDTGLGISPNQTQNAFLSVPQGYRLIITSYDASTLEDKKTRLFLFMRNAVIDNAPWRNFGQINLRGNRRSVAFTNWPSFPTAYDMELRASTESGVEDVTFEFGYIFSKQRFTVVD